MADRSLRALASTAVMLALASPTAFGAGTALKTGFDTDKAGAEPAGWQSGSLDSLGQPIWSVVAAADAPSKSQLLRQSGVAVFNYLVNPTVKLLDGSAAVSFRIESGKEDPEAGLAVRFTDAKNYLYVRANSLEKNLVFYRMHAGKKQLVKSTDAPIAANRWHRLEVEFRGLEFKVRLDGKEYMSFKDDVIKGEGAVGLWTTADTVAGFDDFEASP